MRGETRQREAILGVLRNTKSIQQLTRYTMRLEKSFPISAREQFIETFRFYRRTELLRSLATNSLIIRIILVAVLIGVTMHILKIRTLKKYIN
jgi:hypothetical protein